MAYADEVLADAPAAYYRMDETTGTTLVDASGNGRNGTYTGSPTLGAPGFVGDGTAVDFGDANQTAYAVSTYAGPNATTITIEFWFKKSSPVTDDQYKMMVTHNGSTTSASSFQIQMRPATLPSKVGALDFIRFATAGNETFTTNKNLCDGVAHHVVFVVNGTTLTAYVDGVVDSTFTMAGTLRTTSTEPLRIGRQYFAGGYIQGTLDEVAVYTTALSASRVAAHYAAVPPPPPPEISPVFAGAGALAVDVASGGPVFTVGVTGDMDYWSYYEATQNVRFNAVATYDTIRAGLYGAGVQWRVGFTATRPTFGGPENVDWLASADITSTATLEMREGALDTPLTVPAGGSGLWFVIVQLGADDTAAYGYIASSPTLAGVTTTDPWYYAFEDFGSFSPRTGYRLAWEMDTPPGGGPVITADASFAGSGQLTAEAGGIPDVTTPELTLMILDTVIPQAPTALVVAVVEGVPETDVEFRIDGTLVYVTPTDSDGYLAPTSIDVTEELGAAGDHTLTATQVGAATGSGTFTIERDPTATPTTMGPDAAPVDIPGAVRENGTRRWVFQDLMPGGLGSWIMPKNPREGPMPYSERTFATKVTTAGRAHVSEGAATPVDWQFSGIALDEVFAEKLLAYRDLNRRIYVIDHRGQAFKAVITDVELVPRLMKLFGDDDEYAVAQYINGHDYTVTATVLDQTWVVPE